MQANKPRRIISDELHQTNQYKAPQRVVLLTEFAWLCHGIQTHKLASRFDEIPKMLEHVRRTLENRSIMEGNKYTGHVIKQALVASFVYIMRELPEKILIISCIP